MFARTSSEILASSFAAVVQIVRRERDAGLASKSGPPMISHAFRQCELPIGGPAAHVMLSSFHWVQDQ